MASFVQPFYRGFLTLSAQTDDREAFDTLRAWADDKDNSFHERAEQAWVTVLTQHSSSIAPGSFNITWQEDPSKLALPELDEIYTTTPTRYKPAVISYIFGVVRILAK